MTPWTITLSCPLDGSRFRKINETTSGNRDHITTRTLTIVECEHGHQWEIDVLLARHATHRRRGVES